MASSSGIDRHRGWCLRSGLRCGKGRRRHTLNHGRGRRCGIAADANRLLTLGDFDLGNSGFLQQLDELFYFSNVQRMPPLAQATFGGDEGELIARHAETGDSAEGYVRKE